MIRGTVTATIEAVIVVTVHDKAGQKHNVEAVIDTGFDGWLSLPAAIIKSLGLRWRKRGLGLLADGSESVFDTYEAFVEWDGQHRRIEVDDACIEPLVGMAILKGYELNVQVRPGGSVTIKHLASP